MKRFLAEAVASIGEASLAFPWTDAFAYGDFVAQSYWYTRHSTRLLAVAAGRFAFDPRGDAMHRRLGVHMGEEDRHELLALHDLKCLGRGGIELFTELPSTRLLYEPQYTKVEHHDPMALFGYILPLELVASKFGAFAHQQVVSAFGSPCATFLKVHVEEDESHVEKALLAVEGITSRQEQLIKENIEQTVFCYRAMLQQMVERAPRLSRVTPPLATASAVS